MDLGDVGERMCDCGESGICENNTDLGCGEFGSCENSMELGCWDIDESICEVGEFGSCENNTDLGCKDASESIGDGGEFGSCGNSTELGCWDTEESICEVGEFGSCENNTDLGCRDDFGSIGDGGEFGICGNSTELGCWDTDDSIGEVGEFGSCENNTDLGCGDKVVCIGDGGDTIIDLGAGDEVESIGNGAGWDIMDGISCLLHLSVTFGVESNISTDSSGSMKFSEMFSLLSPKLPSSMICSSMSAGSKVSRPSFSALVLLSPIRDLLGLPLPDCNCTCFFNLSTRSLFVPHKSLNNIIFVRIRNERFLTYVGFSGGTYLYGERGGLRAPYTKSKINSKIGAFLNWAFKPLIFGTKKLYVIFKRPPKFA